MNKQFTAWLASTAGAIGVLALLRLFAPYLGFSIRIGVPSLLVAVTLGVPGMIVLLLLHLLFLG